MPINSGSLATAADVVTLAQDVRARFATFSFSGTFGTAVVKFRATNDPASAAASWVPVEAVKVGDYSTAAGNIGLTDNTAVGYLVFAPGFAKVQAYLVSIVSGTVLCYANSDDTLGAAPALPTPATVAGAEVALIDGAIVTKNGLVVITKGSAAALTLAAPSAGADDGKRLLIVSATAFAHVVTQTTPGINNLSTSGDVATWTNAVGNGMELVAYNGVWYTVSTRNVSIA